MEVFTTPAAMRAWSAARRSSGDHVALVPTMGALHRGHLELIGVASGRGTPVVSIFVNPLQFNRAEDFDGYPRPVEHDLEQCRAAGAGAVYAPTAATMYPTGCETRVVPGSLAEPMEGAGRPGHFAGVTTVVTKLFHATVPDVAVFGTKDFQQLAVIRRMVRDLDFGIEIVAVPTVREPDGLALSSRNQLLTPAERSAATCVPRALDRVVSRWSQGARDAANVLGAGRAEIAAEPLARLEYLELSDPESLRPVEAPKAGSVVCAAVWFGSVRLIDNVELP